MTSVQRNRTTHPPPASRHVAQGFFAAALAMLGGCSADVTRFDFPAFNLTESGSNTQTGSLPRAGYEPSLAQRGPGPYDGPRGAGVGGYQPTQPYPSQGQRRIRARAGSRPPARPSCRRSRSVRSPERYAGRTPDRVPDRVPERAAAPERRYEAQRPSASGDTIEVQPGDTLFGIAKRHGVQVGTLIEVNGMANGTSIKPGQRLVLPAGATPARTETRTPVASRPATQPDPAADPNGRHRYARLGRPLHPAAGRLALQHRPPASHHAGRPAARQRASRT